MGYLILNRLVILFLVNIELILSKINNKTIVMKKIISLLLSVFTTILFYGQTANPSVDFSEGNGTLYSSLNQQGQIFFNPYYGLPNTLSAGVDLNNNLFLVSKSNETIKTTGPLGLLISYMISEDIGIGLDFNYSSCNKSFNYVNFIDLITYNMDASRTIIRVMGRVDYHLHVNDILEGYLGLGAGFRDHNNNYSSTDPDYFELINEESNFAFRVSGGLNIFITNQIGINSEFGIGGGGLVRLGIFYKLI